MKQATVLAVANNAAVVQLPDRHFPALALQGDTFYHAVKSLQDLKVHLRTQRGEEELRLVLDTLEEALGLYENWLTVNRISPPW